MSTHTVCVCECAVLSCYPVFIVEIEGSGRCFYVCVHARMYHIVAVYACAHRMCVTSKFVEKMGKNYKMRTPVMFLLRRLLLCVTCRAVCVCIVYALRMHLDGKILTFHFLLHSFSLRWTNNMKCDAICVGIIKSRV